MMTGGQPFRASKAKNQHSPSVQALQQEVRISQKLDASFSMILQARLLNTCTGLEELLGWVKRVKLYYSYNLLKLIICMIYNVMHGVSLKEYPLEKVLESFPLHGQKQSRKNFVTIEMHPWVLFLQEALESFISAESRMRKLTQDAFCSWVRAYTAHRGDLKRIFVVKKLHLGHVARSFGLKDQPSLVGRSRFQTQAKKRKRDQGHVKSSKKRKLATKGGKNIRKYRHFLVL